MATISTPGIGSGLNVDSIVSKLMQVESLPLVALQNRQASYEAKISAYGTIQSALSSFQTAVSALSSASQFQAFSTTASDTSVLSASASSLAKPGSYNVTVNSLAQAQSLSSSGQATTASPLGTGTATTLSFQFGTITGTAVNGSYTGASFAADASQPVGNVVIDNSNNSLQGIRDAINAAQVGVTASLVNDGNPYTPFHLLISSNSTGAAQSLKITSSGGDTAVTSLLAYDPAGTQNLTQTMNAQSASLAVNGLAINSASNAVTGAVPGVTLNLTKGGGATSTISIANNTSSVATAIQALVTSYNSVNSTIVNLTAYNSTSKSGGLLLGDFTTQNIQAKLRSTLSTAVPGLSVNAGLTNLSQVGVSFLKDGSLSLDSTKLQTSLSSNFSDFSALFAAVGKSTDSLVNYAGSTPSSKAGNYAISVSTLATRGTVTGTPGATQSNLDGSTNAGLTIDSNNNQILLALDGNNAIPVRLTSGAPYASSAALATQLQSDMNTALGSAGQSSSVTVSSFGGKLSIRSNTTGSASAISITDGTNGSTENLLGTPATTKVSTITAGSNDQLALTINGTSGIATIPAGTYSASDLATQIQAAINGTQAFTQAGVSSLVSQSAGILTLSAASYGSSSSIAITSSTAGTTLFGKSPVTATGVDVAGSINGVAAVGLGQSLTGASGDASEGLRIQIGGGNTGARGILNFSKGYGFNLKTLANSYLDSTSGPLASSTDSATRNIADLTKQTDALNVRLAATQARYQAQYTALDVLISNMSSTSSFLTQQLANLPKAS